MELINTTEALNEIAKDFKLRLIRDTKVKGLVASKNFVNSWEVDVVGSTIEVSNSSQHAQAALDGNPKSNKAQPSSRNISSWMRMKNIRPYMKQKNGSTRFIKATESAYNRAGFAIAKAIREKGSIKRFGYKPSRLIEEVYAQVERKIGLEITEAFRKDLINEINRVIKVQQ